MARKRSKESVSSLYDKSAKRKKIEQTTDPQELRKSGRSCVTGKHGGCKDTKPTKQGGKSNEKNRSQTAKVKLPLSKKDSIAKTSSTAKKKGNQSSDNCIKDDLDLDLKKNTLLKLQGNDCKVSLSPCKIKHRLLKTHDAKSSKGTSEDNKVMKMLPERELGHDSLDDVDGVKEDTVDKADQVMTMDDDDDDSDDNMDWEDVEEAKGHHEALSHEKEELSLVEGEGLKSEGQKQEFKNVEISINVSGKKSKKKKTHDDLMKCIEKAMVRFNKEVQVNMHKVHLLALVARGLYRNSICSDSVLKAVSLSYVPASLIPKSKTKWEITDLTKFLAWFQNDFPGLQDMGAIVEKHGRTVKYMKPINQAEVFVLLLRSLGFLARLVFSLQPVSLKNGKDAKNSPKQTATKNAARSIASGSTPRRVSAVRVPESNATSIPSKIRKMEADEKQTETRKAKSHQVREKDATLEEMTDSNIDSALEFSSNLHTSLTRRNTPKRRTREPAKSDAKGIPDKKLRILNKKKLRKRKKVDYSVDGSAISSEDEWKSYSESETSGYSEDDPKQVLKNKGKSPAASSSVKTPVVDLLDDDSDFEVTSKPLVKRRSSQGSKSSSNAQVISDDSDESVKGVAVKRTKHVLGTDVWAEVYLPSRKDWICVDMVTFSVNHPDVCESNATQPVTYVVAYDNDNRAKDVTSRYASNWLSKTQKQRVDADWWDDTLAPYNPRNKKMEERENSLLQAQQQDKPLPQSIGEFKNHPLYVLRRHLLKFEGIYPESAATHGFIRGEAVYSRDCVHLLHTREKWMNEALVVKQGETAYKVVKGRAKRNKPSVDGREVTIDLFGRWQTEEYKPPPAVDGKVPRNEYGNVELFKPSMLPPGTRHIKIPGIVKTARKLGIDAVQAVTGFDFHCGFSHPIIDGVVVCEEHVDTLMDAWRQEQEEMRRKKEEKREKRVLGYWKLFVRSILIRERLRRKYEAQESRASSEFGESLEDDKSSQDKVDDTCVAWPLNMQEGKTSVDTDGHCHVFPKRRNKKDKLTGEWIKSCSCGLTLPLDK